MMRAFAAALLSACNSGCGRADPPSSRPATLGDVKALAEQVRGGACSFGRSRESARCTHFALPALAWLNDRYLGSSPTRRYACVADAAECLAEFGTAARDATPALIEALERGPNDYDTGDGVIPSRSYVAAALGKLEDPRAIESLGRALRSGARRWTAGPARWRAVSQRLAEPSSWRWRGSAPKRSRTRPSHILLPVLRSS
jgi:hypothetical protein